MFSYLPIDEDWLGDTEQHTGPSHGGEVQRSVEITHAYRAMVLTGSNLVATEWLAGWLVATE